MKLKQAKLYSKKTLSVFLATIMLVMTCSVAFGVSALTSTTDTNAIDNLYTKIIENVDIVEAIYSQDDSILTYSKDDTVTNNTTYTSLSNYVTVYDYDDYVAFIELVEAVWYAADYCVQYNEEGDPRTNYVYNPSSTDSDKFYGETINTINQSIQTRLNSKNTQYGSYYDALVDLVFGWWAYGDSTSTDITNCLGGVDGQRQYDSSSWTKSLGSYTGSTYGYLLFNLVVTTTDAVGWFDYNDASDYENMTLKSTYTAEMVRNSGNSLRFWGFDKYDSNSNYGDEPIIGDSKPVEEATTYCDNIIKVANSYKTVLSEALVAYPTFEDIYDLYLNDRPAFEATKNQIDANYSALVNAVSDADSDTSDEAKIIAAMFADSDKYADLIANFEVAEDIAPYITYAQTIDTLVTTNTGYGTFNNQAFDRATIIADYATYTTNYNKLQTLSDDAYEFITSEYDLGEGTYYTAFTNNVNAYYAQDTKDSLDALLATYGEYTQAEVEALDSTLQSTIYTQFNTLLTKAEKYSSVVYDAVFEDGLEAYYTVSALFQCSTNSTVAYFVEMGIADLTEYSTDYLIECLDSFDSDYAKLVALETAVGENTGDPEFAEEVFASVFDYADELEGRIYEVLALTFTTQVATAVAAAPASLTASDMTPYLYGTLKLSIGEIETEIYDIDEVVALLSDKTISDYASLTSIISIYTAYASSFGFSSYEETVYYDDQYQTDSNGDYILDEDENKIENEYYYDDREVYDEDMFKTETYEVDESGVSSIITLLDGLLTDSEVIALVADLLGMTVDSATASLGSIVQALVSDMLFSDSIINMIVGLVYPLIEGEFSKIEENELPDSVILVSGFIEIDITYNKTLADIVCDPQGLAINPESVAWVLDPSTEVYSGSFTAAEDYSFMAEGIKQLYDAGDNWYSSSIYDAATGTWIINWGMDDYIAEAEAKGIELTFDDLIAQFIKSAGAALEGLYPLLAALLADQTWSTSRGGIAYANFWGVDYSVGIDLTISGSYGYLNVLGPIYEVLGYYEYSDSSDLDAITNATEFLTLIYSDIKGLITELLSSPVENILTVIPGLVYALMFDMIPGLLNLLDINISYEATATSLEISAITDSMSLNIGDMLDLSTIIDTSGGLSGILEDLLGISLSGLNEGILATLGELDVVSSNRTASIYGLSSGQAYQITGNSEAVLYYLLTWLLDSIGNGSFYELLGAFLDDETVAMVEEYVAYTDIDINQSGDVIAAVVELLNSDTTYGDAEYFSADEYDGRPYIHVGDYVPVLDENNDIQYGPYGYTYNVDTGYFEPNDYSDIYTEYWTQETAEYVVSDLPNYITEIAALLELDTEVVELLTSTVDDLLLTAFSTDTVDMLLDFIQPLVQEYAVDDETISMIVELVDAMGLIDNIDILDIVDHIVNFTYASFEDGDRDAFLAVIVDFLKPLVPVLDFLLISCDEEEAYDGDLSLLDGSISLSSYNGYESALIPLLENLGCDPDSMTAYDDFKTLGNEEKLYAILDPICDLLDTYLASEDEYAIFGVLGIIPNILYFITGENQNGENLKTLISNFLRPVYVILDTIRPIYSLNFTLDLNTDYLMGLINGLINDLIASADIENYVGITLDIESILDALLTFGYTEERASVTGGTYNYFVLSDETYAEMLTVTLDAVLEEVVFGEEIQQYVDLLGSLGGVLGEDSEIGAFLIDLSEMESSDQVMLVLYYLVYGLETGTDLYDSMSDTVKDFLTDFLGDINSEYVGSIFDRTSELLDDIFSFLNPDEDPEENETLSWFQQLLADIKAFFEKIFGWLSI